MVTHKQSLMIFLLTLFASLSVQALTLRATVDAKEIQTGDSLQLTVSVDETAFGKQPDISALKEDFEILNTSSTTQMRMVNGQITRQSKWHYTLLPKSSGYLVIPPITYDGQQTEPITIKVTERKNSTKKANDRLVFVEAHVDKNEVFVQEQVIFTFRLYKRTQLIDPSFSQIDIPDAVMEKLGEQRQFQTDINGKTFNVIETKFAVFPQKSGEITIPPIELMATIASTRRGFFFDPMGMSGKQIRRTTQPIKLTVKPKPDNYPDTAPWLPARKLQLKETWSPQNPTFKVGEPVTRTIILEAEGLAASVLPPLPKPDSGSFKVYPDKAENNSRVGPDGLISDRIESFAYIPTQAGEQTLPAIQVYWWNIQTQTLETAQIPERTITVAPSSAPQATGGSASQPPAAIENDPLPATPLQGRPEVSYTWIWIALIVTVLWAATVIGFLIYIARLKRKTRPDQVQEKEKAENQNKLIKEAKEQLKQSCQEDNAKAAAQALIRWASLLAPGQSVHSLGDVRRLFNNPEFNQSLNYLEQILYKDDKPSEWEGTRFWEAIEDLEVSLQKPENKPTALAPLYPETA